MNKWSFKEPNWRNCNSSPCCYCCLKHFWSPGFVILQSMTQANRPAAWVLQCVLSSTHAALLTTCLLYSTDLAQVCPWLLWNIKPFFRVRTCAHWGYQTSEPWALRQLQRRQSWHIWQTLEVTTLNYIKHSLY